MLQPLTHSVAKPRTRTGRKLTNADYLAQTPPSHRGRRYQLINGELIEMAGPNDPHQVFALRLGAALMLQSDALDIGEIRIAPYDAHINLSNTFQPDLLFISNTRRPIIQRTGAYGAPTVVVEILSDSTRRRDLSEKLPVYLAAGVGEVVIVDLDTRTAAVYTGAGGIVAPARVFGADDVLTLDGMPGVSVALGPIFARALD